MAVDINDPNMKNVMNYVNDRIKKQNLRGINLFRAAETQPGLVEENNKTQSTEVDKIRQKVQKELHSKKEIVDVNSIIKLKPSKPIVRQK